MCFSLKQFPYVVYTVNIELAQLHYTKFCPFNLFLSELTCLINVCSAVQKCVIKESN